MNSSDNELGPADILPKTIFSVLEEESKFQQTELK